MASRLSPITVPGGQVVPSNIANYDGNLLVENRRAMNMIRLPDELWALRHNIIAIVNHHFGSKGGDFKTVEPRANWGEKEFKISFLVEREGKSADGDDEENQAFMQIFEATSNGEDANPGAVEERIRVDVASWVLLRKLVPGIRVPKIIGFGFPNGSQFTHVSQLTQEDADSYVKRREDLSNPDAETIMTPFVPHECGNKMPEGVGYILFEPVFHPGQLLGDVWNTNPSMTQMKNLWTSIASIIVSLAGQTYSKIGSYTFNDSGSATLTNRPLYHAIVQLERDGGSPIMARDETFKSSIEFIEALLKAQDDRVVKHPHAISSETHGRSQMAFRTLVHGLVNHLIPVESGKTAFVAQLIDLDVDHFMVDEDWNVTGLLDVGSIAILPIEMVQEPQWLTGVLVDEQENTFSSRVARPAFIQLIRRRQRELAVQIDGPSGPISLADIMKEVWDTKAYWLFVTLTTSYDMSNMAGPQLLPKFAELCDEEIDEVDNAVWGPDPEGVVQRAMRNRYHYFRQIAAKFGPGGEYGPDREHGAGHEYIPDIESDYGIDPESDYGIDPESDYGIDPEAETGILFFDFI